jgi:hypothetical protein
MEDEYPKPKNNLLTSSSEGLYGKIVKRDYLTRKSRASIKDQFIPVEGDNDSME